MFNDLSGLIGSDTGNASLDNANLLTGLGGIAGGLGSVFGGFAESKSQKLRSDILKQNAESLRAAAKDARFRGREIAQDIKVQTQQLISQQRAAIASNGLVIDQDTALDLVTETAGVGAVDALTAIANSEREAARLLREASVSQAEAQVESEIGDQAVLGGVTRGFQTVLSSRQTINRRTEQFSTEAT